MKNTRWMMIAMIAMVAASCGGDDAGSGATSDDPTVLEVAAVLQRDQDFPVSDDEANCAAQRIVENVPSDDLDRLLADPETDLSAATDPGTALDVLDGIFDCVDVETMMIEQMVADGTPKDDAECLAAGFGEDELREFMRVSAAGDDTPTGDAGLALLGKMFELAAECGISLGG